MLQDYDLFKCYPVKETVCTNVIKVCPCTECYFVLSAYQLRVKSTCGFVANVFDDVRKVSSF